MNIYNVIFSFFVFVLFGHNILAVHHLELPGDKDQSRRLELQRQLEKLILPSGAVDDLTEESGADKVRLRDRSENVSHQLPVPKKKVRPCALERTPCVREFAAELLKRPQIIPNEPAFAERKRSSSDSELKERNKDCQVQRMHSDEEILLNVPRDCQKNESSKKKAKLPKRQKSAKKKKSDFEHRKSLYLLDYYTSLRTQKRAAEPLSVSVGQIKFETLKNAVSRDILIGYLRESEFFQDEYELLRGLVRANLDTNLEAIRNDELDFLNINWTRLYDMACAAKIAELEEEHFRIFDARETIALSADKIETILDHLSSQERYLRYQTLYVEFLERHFLDIAQNAPEAVKEFFHQLYLSIIPVLGEKTSLELVTSNFILYMVNPLLNKLKEYDLIFSDEDLVAIESEQMNKLHTPSKMLMDSIDEKLLVAHVANKMKEIKNDHNMTMWRKDPKTSRILLLVKLIQKTFMEDGAFSPLDYADFKGQFYLVLGKKDSPLKQRLAIFKNNLGKALLLQAEQLQ